MGVHHIPAGGKDPQHPHDADEVHVVLAGRGALEVEGERIPVGPGRVVSVDRGADQRFTDVDDDLSVLVVFAPPATPEA